MGLRNKIIETALQLFEAKGYHGVSINEIVTAAETSKGGFYHHFASKDELLYVIHDIFITHAIESAQKADRLYETATERMQGIIKDFVNVFHLYKPHLAVFYQEAKFLPSEYAEIIKEKRTQFRLIIEGVIKEGKEQGEFREEIDVNIVTMAILGIVNWTQQWYEADGEKSISEIAHIYNDFILRAILKEELLQEEAFKSVYH